MRKLFSYVGGPLIATVTFVWSAVKFTLDQIGRVEIMTSVPTEAAVVAAGLAWLFATPWWVPGAIGLLVAATWAWIGFSLVYRRAEKNKAPDETKINFIKTSLKLQFFGDIRIPQIIQEENVAFWYTYFSPHIKLVTKNKSGGDIGAPIETPLNWIIFVTFKEPTAYRQATITFSNPTAIHQMEVREANSVALVAMIHQQVPPGVIDITTIP